MCHYWPRRVYLVPLPLSPGNAALLDQAVTAAVEGDQVCELIWDGPRLLGAGYELSRRVQADGDAEGPDWAERVQVVRSRDLAEGHARTLEQNLVVTVQSPVVISSFGAGWPDR